MLFLSDRFEESKTYLDKALIGAEKLQHDAFLMRTLNSLAQVYIAIGNPTESKSAAFQAMQYADNIGDILTKTRITRFLAQLYAKDGENNEALHFVKKAFRVCSTN